MLNPLHPVASGGFIGNGDILSEDFVAVTTGATYRADRWSLTGRAEYRAGSRDDRYGFTAAALRQIGEGSALGAAANWFTAKSENGAEQHANCRFLAHRRRRAAVLVDLVEVREDRATGRSAACRADRTARQSQWRRALGSIVKPWVNGPT